MIQRTWGGRKKITNVEMTKKIPIWRNWEGKRTEKKWNRDLWYKENEMKEKKSKERKMKKKVKNKKNVTLDAYLHPRKKKDMEM